MSQHIKQSDLHYSFAQHHRTLTSLSLDQFQSQYLSSDVSTCGALPKVYLNYSGQPIWNMWSHSWNELHQKFHKTIRKRYRYCTHVYRYRTLNAYLHIHMYVTSNVLENVRQSEENPWFYNFFYFFEGKVKCSVCTAFND